MVSQASETRESAQASGVPLQRRRSDTISTQDTEEADRGNKNYGNEKLWGRRATVREGVKYKVEE